MDTDVALPPELLSAISQSSARTVWLDLERFEQKLSRLSPQARAGVLGAMDEVQIRSKLWLIDELSRCRDLATTRLVVLGAWYGVLPLLINWRTARPPRRMVCIDFDLGVCEVGQALIGAMYDNITYECADVMDLDYDMLGKNPATVVINTICEHLPQLGDWWRLLPGGQFVVLQSNNYFACPDHVNAVHSLDELKHLVPLSKLLFEGVLPLPIMDRYMLIGHR
jgi:hypothetical protein